MERRRICTKGRKERQYLGEAEKREYLGEREYLGQGEKRKNI